MIDKERRHVGDENAARNIALRGSIAADEALVKHW
jgi:hypothetical protein